MNLVFMNSLERKVDETHVQTAQVLIQEEEGLWYVLWHETNEQGKQVQDDWFQGRNWDEMLAVFRYRLAEKLATGYTPLLNSLFEYRDERSGRSRLSQVLNYYSEMNEQEELYQKLRKWRTEQSAKEGKAPYLIASNRMLRMLSTFLPYNREELLQIPGMGEKKFDMYGDAILELTKTQERKHSFPLDWVLKQVDQEQFERWIYKKKEEKYKQEVDKLENKKKMLQGIHDGLGIEELTASIGIVRRDVVLWIEQLEQEGYDVSRLVDNELATIPDEDKKRAWSAYEELGDRYLKPILQKTFDEEQLKGQNIDLTYEWLRLLRLQYRKSLEGKKAS